MAKTEQERKKQNKADDKKRKDGKGKKEGKGKKDKKEKEYEPGMASSEYDPCPHRVWNPKPGERDKSEPRGVGSPWYEPVRKKEDVDKEEAEKKEKKEKKASEKRQKGYEERQKQKEEEDKKREEEEKKKAEKEKKREKKKKKREKEKKKKEDEKRRKQKEEREKKKEEEEKAAEDDKGKKKEKEKEKEKPQASYMYEPCPHRVYTPSPGEKDMADPKGVGSPWYIPVRKKEDLEKEQEEKREGDSEKRKKAWKKRQQEKKEQEAKEEEERIKYEERMEKEERKAQERRRKEIERRKQEREQEDIEHEEMGKGVRKSETDFTPELVVMMDFIRSVDEKERERRGQALRWKKEEVEKDIESHLAKEAFTRDFQGFITTFIEAEWGKADKKLRKLKKDERRKRKRIFKNMDPLAKELMEEGKRFNTLYEGAMGKKRKEAGDGEPSAMEDMMVSMIMQQMDKLVEPASGKRMQEAFYSRL